jgi:hypothetical protein
VSCTFHVLTEPAREPLRGFCFPAENSVTGAQRLGCVLVVRTAVSCLRAA